jgi:uncharacterized protein (DUF1501 family)
MTASRREFLRRGGCAALSASAFASTLARFGAVDAFAQSDHAAHHHFVPSVASDYRALVCVFLSGGNDAWNSIVDLTQYGSYAAARPTIALPQGTLLPIRPVGDARTFGLHPSLGGLQSLFVQRKLAVVCNVGTLVEPLTRAEYQSKPALRPPNLFSHSDQVYEWNTGIAAPPLTTGWGGRTADRTLSLNGSAIFPMIVTLSGSTVFGTGTVARAFELGAGGSVALAGFNSSSTSQIRYAALRDLLGMNRELTFVRSAGDTVKKALDTDALVTQALATAPPLQTVFPAGSLGDQLRMVARLISARNILGLHRQIFFVQIGGFDTHSGQLTAQGGLLTQLNAGLVAFFGAMMEMGVPNDVTLFTSSDFGRAYRSNGGGTDHGWGSCQFVMGGAVRGGDFVGDWPTLALGGPDDSGTQGRFIPKISVDQYAATLAKWYGLPPTDVPTVFPNISHFDTADLGFMG